MNLAEMVEKYKEAEAEWERLRKEETVALSRVLDIEGDIRKELNGKVGIIGDEVLFIAPYFPYSDSSKRLRIIPLK